MNQQERLAAAETVVEEVLRELPEELRQAARECLLILDEAEGDFLGLFEGASRLQSAPSDPEDVPRITLYLTSLWDFAHQHPATYRREVRVTYLHELGHYLGWEEDDLEARGLG
ncbi:MAG: metallopeptidase family protein [Verrucomicrobiota bacterium]